jgi:hypothetical protein
MSLKVAVEEFLALIGADGRALSREKAAGASQWSQRDYDLAVEKMRDELASESGA